MFVSSFVVLEEDAFDPNRLKNILSSFLLVGCWEYSQHHIKIYFTLGACKSQPLKNAVE
jgi:hypothetical protein